MSDHRIHHNVKDKRAKNRACDLARVMAERRAEEVCLLGCHLHLVPLWGNQSKHLGRQSMLMKLHEGPFLMEGSKGLGPIQTGLEKIVLVHTCKLLEELGFNLGGISAAGCSKSMETVMEFHLRSDTRVDDAFKDLQDYFQEADASGTTIWFWNLNLDAEAELLGQL